MARVRGKKSSVETVKETKEVKAKKPATKKSSKEKPAAKKKPTAKKVVKEKPAAKKVVAKKSSKEKEVASTKNLRDEQRYFAIGLILKNKLTDDEIISKVNSNKVSVGLPDVHKSLIVRWRMNINSYYDFSARGLQLPKERLIEVKK